MTVLFRSWLANSDVLNFVDEVALLIVCFTVTLSDIKIPLVTADSAVVIINVAILPVNPISIVSVSRIYAGRSSKYSLLTLAFCT